MNLITPTGGVGPNFCNSAVKVTVCPCGILFCDETNVSVGDALLIVLRRSGEVLVAKLSLPLYTALNVCVPTPRLDVVNKALPLIKGTVAIAVVPSKNVTV